MANSGFISASRPNPRDAKSCEEWLKQAELTDPRQAASSFLALLDEIENTPPSPAACLQILERLRPAIGAVHDEQIKRFSGKPLPLSQTENAAFVQDCDLWIALLNAYRSLWKSALEGNAVELESFLALVCHRVIACTASLIEVHQLARREVKPVYWLWLHEAYAAAESRALSLAPVVDGSSESHCVAVYAQPLLIQLADPYVLSLRDMAWLRRWTRRWARKARMRRVIPSTGGYGVDLEGREGVVWLKADIDISSGRLRYLDLAAVGQSVVRRIQRLADGANISELGLGRDCTQPGTGELLQTLARSWLATPNKIDASVKGSFELVGGLAAVCRALGGAGGLALQQSDNPPDRSYLSAQRLHIFQSAQLVSARKQTRNRDIEHWESLHASARELRLNRREGGARVAHRQLVALRPRGTESFELREIISLAEGADQSLSISTIPALSETARVCEIRPVAGISKDPVEFTPALMLPAAGDQSPFLALPAGWYQHGRMIELWYEGKSRKIRLVALLAHGFDYDSVSYIVEA